MRTPIESFGIRIDGKNGLSGQILRRVGDKPVLTDGNHQIRFAEREPRHEFAIDQVALDSAGDGLTDFRQYLLMFLVSYRYSFERLACLFQVELRLCPGVKARHEIIELGLPSHDDHVFILRRSQGPIPWLPKRKTRPCSGDPA